MGISARPSTAIELGAGSKARVMACNFERSSSTNSDGFPWNKMTYVGSLDYWDGLAPPNIGRRICRQLIRCRDALNGVLGAGLPISGLLASVRTLSGRGFPDTRLT